MTPDDENGYGPIYVYAVGLYTMFATFKTAGFSDEQAFRLILEHWRTAAQSAIMTEHPREGS